MQLQKEIPRSTLAGTHTGHLTTSVDEELIPPEIEPVNLHEAIRETSAFIENMVYDGEGLDKIVLAAGEFVSANGYHHITENDLFLLAGGIYEKGYRQPDRGNRSQDSFARTIFNTVGVGSLTANEPKEREFIAEGLLPARVAGVLAAPGGTGKSLLLLTLSMHLAAGRPFLGHAIPRPRGVLICSAEDDLEEVHRRTHAIRMASQYDGEPFTGDDLDRVHIADLVGNTEEIVTMDGNNAVINEGAVSRIVETAKGIDDLGLIILDPVARFRSGGENDSGAATCFVKALEIVRKATGAAVIVAHHSRKGSTGESADDIRGSSALVDACRWAATLSNLPPNVARKEYAIDEIERKSLVRFKVVKENYTAPTDEVWLQRGKGGVLRKAQAPLPKKELRSNADYEKFLHGLDGLVCETGGITRRKLRDYAGVDGTFGVGEKKLKQFIDRGIRENRVHLEPDGCLKVTAIEVVS